VPFSRKTEEEKASIAAQKAADREAKAREKLMRAFYSSPAGQARLSYVAGAQVFQYETDVKATKSVVRPIFLGSSAMGKETLLSRIGRGPVDTLNAVCNEGWELVSGSFVFVETGQVSRSKALSSGQQVATSGTVIGYYLFRRNEASKRKGSDPWDVSEADAVELADQIDE
jgi:hypothetical protein